MSLQELVASAENKSQNKLWTEAIDAWGHVLSEKSDFHEALFRIAEAHLGLKQFSQAMSNLEAYIRVCGGGTQAKSLKAMIFSQAGYFEDAVAAWKEIVTLLPDNFLGWARLSEAAIEISDRELARKAIRNALKLRPEDTFIARMQKRLIVGDKPAKKITAPSTPAPKAKSPAKAEKKPEKQKKTTVRYSHLQALDFTDQELWSEAATAREYLYSKNPDEMEMGLHLWQAQHNLKDYKASHVTLAKVLRPTLKTYALFESLAEEAVDLNGIDALASDLVGACTAQPELDGLAFNAAKFLKLQGRAPEALSILEIACGDNPRADRLGGEYSKSLFEARDYARLAQKFAPWVETADLSHIDGSTATICYQVGLALISFSRVDEAAPLIEAAWKQRPVGQLALRAFGNLCVRQGRFDTLIEAIEQAFEAVKPAFWPWLEGVRLLIDAEQEDLANAVLNLGFANLYTHPDNYLSFASRLPFDQLEDAVIAALENLDIEQDNHTLTLSQIALSKGAVELAKTRFAALKADTKQSSAGRSLAAKLKLADEALEKYGAGENMRLQDALFALLGERLADESPDTENLEKRPVLLINSAMGAGGAERQIAFTLTGLAQRLGGTERLKLICTRLTDAPERRLNLPPVLAAGIEVFDLSSTPPATAYLYEQKPHLRNILELLPASVVEDMAKLYRVYKDMRPAVAHLWQDRTSVDGGLAAIMAGVPEIIMIARSTRPASRQRYKAYFHGAYQAILRHKNVILANNSQSGAYDYEDWLSLEANSVAVVHNGYNFTAMSARATDAAVDRLRQRWGLGADTPVLGGILRFAEVKRPLLWIEVAAQVAKSLPDARFLLCGEGPLEGEVRALAERLGIADKLILPGFVDPAPYMRLMQVNLLTSVTEGLPNVLLEAQAFGVPSVSTDVGGARETLIDGETGFVVASDNPKILAKSVIKIMKDQDWRDKARQKAIDFAYGRFSQDAMLDKTLALYERSQREALQA